METQEMKLARLQREQQQRQMELRLGDIRISVLPDVRDALACDDRKSIQMYMKETQEAVHRV